MPANAADHTPTVSSVLDDGRVVELIYDALERNTELVVGRPDGNLEVVSHLDLDSGERLVPYSARNNLIATGCVLLPARPEPYGGKQALLDEIRVYLHRYVDLSPTFEDIAAHYVLFSWVYDAFKEAPYLRFRGDYGTGKTRALLALGSICYKPVFASGASTVSPLFHILDAFQGTLVLDEADFRFTDATAALTKILNNGNVAGMPVLRTMQNRNKEFDPKAFRVFGPKLVGMRERFSDEALESRFLTEETGLRQLRSDIPIQLPGSLAEDALRLRNKLLSWRFAARSTVAADPTRVVDGVEPRLNQTALPLLSMIDDASVRDRVHQMLKDEDRRLRQDRAESAEAAMVEAVLPFFTRATGPRPSVSAIARNYNQRSGAVGGRPASDKWVGWFLRARLKLTTTKSNGVYIVSETERAKILALATRYGVGATDDAGGG